MSHPLICANSQAIPFPLTAERAQYTRAVPVGSVRSTYAMRRSQDRQEAIPAVANTNLPHMGMTEEEILASWAKWETNFDNGAYSSQPQVGTRTPRRSSSRSRSPATNSSSSATETMHTSQSQNERNVHSQLTQSRRQRTRSQRSNRSVHSSRPGYRAEDQKHTITNEEEIASMPAEPAAPSPVIAPSPVPQTTALPSLDAQLSTGSTELVSWDMRFPRTYARKKIRQIHWTHLNFENLSKPACHPPRDCMTVCVYDWKIDVRAREREMCWEEYVIVQDVLDDVYTLLRENIEQTRWACDKIDMRFSNEVKHAFYGRIRTLEKKKVKKYKHALEQGLMRVDYLGSSFYFNGLSLEHAIDGSERWILNVSSEPRS